MEILLLVLSVLVGVYLVYRYTRKDVSCGDCEVVEFSWLNKLDKPKKSTVKKAKKASKNKVK